MVVRAAELEEQNVFVTAHRSSLASQEVGSSTQILTHSQIQQTSNMDLSSALQSIPGIVVQASGGNMGQPRTLSLRGAPSDATLVLINGISMNDISSPGRGYNFAHLDVTQIERIEIVRGSQSILYGSDALGGVINIITKESEPPKISLIGGSYRTYFSSLYSNGFSASAIKSSGFSNVNNPTGSSEPDGYSRTSFSLHRSYQWAEHTKLKLFGLYSQAFTETDVNSTDTIGTNIKDDFFVGGLTLIHLLFEDQMKITTGFQGHSMERVNVASTNSTLTSDKYLGQWQKLFIQSEIFDLYKTSLTLGIEESEEKSTTPYLTCSDASAFSNCSSSRTSIQSLFVENHGKWQNLFYSLGLRKDEHSLFSIHNTYRGTLGVWLIPSALKLRTSYGTGFKTPSHFQLYSSFGNPQLQANQSQTQDIGFEYFSNENLSNKSLSGSFEIFKHRYFNLIDYDFSSQKYKNTAETEAIGYEVSVNYMKNPIEIQSSYTQNSVLDMIQKARKPYSPLHSYHFGMTYHFNEKQQLHLNSHTVSERAVNSMDSTTLPARTVVNANYEHQWDVNWILFGKVDNLFDALYEDISGYNTSRLSFYFGIRSND